jgi:hypothetical protein
MRAQLLAIEKADLLRGNTPNKLQQQYHDLLEQMDELRIKMENHAR